MKTRSKADSQEKREILPTAPKEEEVKFGPASSWGRGQLRLLGVNFYMKQRIDLNRVLRVRDSDWSSELRARMSHSRDRRANCQESMKAPDNLELLTRWTSIMGLSILTTSENSLLPRFLATFTALLATLEIQEMKERAKLAKQESQASSSGINNHQFKTVSRSPRCFSTFQTCQSS